MEALEIKEHTGGLARLCGIDRVTVWKGECTFFECEEY